MHSRLPSLRDVRRPEGSERVGRRWDKASSRGDEDIAAPDPCRLEAVSRGASLGSSSGSGLNRMLHFVFDSDGDTDPDTDACDTGGRPDFSSILTEAGRHVDSVVLLGIEFKQGGDVCIAVE